MYYDSFSSPEAGLPQGLFAPFFAAGHPMSYPKGQIIYIQGQEPEYLYCLGSGAVRTLMTSDEGEVRLLTTYGPGSIFGEASFFDGMPRVSTAEAATDCKIVRLSHDKVSELFRAHPELASAMITYLARTVRLLSGHVDTMSFQSAQQRLANLLLNHPQGDEIHVTHEELAAALGLSRVTISRLLGSFARQGLLKTGYGTIRLLDRERLGELE